jgi:hypothetical protein
MKIICAWCQTVLRDGPGPISHGICRRCAGQYAEFYPEMRDYRRLVDWVVFTFVLTVSLLALGLSLWRCR